MGLSQSVMKQFFLVSCSLLVAGILRAERQCGPSQSKVIDSEVRCVDQGGISIGIGDEEGAKVACMQSKVVQNRCGPDGRLTRLRAYTVWLDKLSQFERTCNASGGTFAYQDPTFVEPVDESYCLQAIPEVGSNMFEEPLCNFRSICPPVTVLCETSCTGRAVAQA